MISNAFPDQNSRNLNSVKLLGFKWQKFFKLFSLIFTEVTTEVSALLNLGLSGDKLSKNFQM